MELMVVQDNYHEPDISIIEMYFRKYGL